MIVCHGTRVVCSVSVWLVLCTTCSMCLYISLSLLLLFSLRSGRRLSITFCLFFFGFVFYLVACSLDGHLITGEVVGNLVCFVAFIDIALLRWLVMAILTFCCFVIS